jgi:hydrogenase-4 component F
LLLSGLPPSALFLSEIAILLGGFALGWGLAAGLAAILLALTAAGFLFHVGRVSFGRVRRADATVAGTARMRALRALGLALPLVLVGILGVWTPDVLAAAIDRVAAVLGGVGG